MKQNIKWTQGAYNYLLLQKAANHQNEIAATHLNDRSCDGFLTSRNGDLFEI